MRKTLYQLLDEISFTRTSGTKEELKCANMIKEEIKAIGGVAEIVPFEVTQTKFSKVGLKTTNKEYEVTGYKQAKVTEEEGLTAQFYYMQSNDKIDKYYAKDKIVLVNGYLRKPMYEALTNAQAVGFISFAGDVYDENADIDIRELRSTFFEDGILPGVHMRTIDAMNLVKENPKEITLTLRKEELMVNSHNVIAEIKGTKYPDEVIVYTAHYDSVLFSKGAYDNGAGSVILVKLFEYFYNNKPTRTVRFIWCGSEERGLLGSKAYVANLEEKELEKIVLNVNVDVAGTVLGKDSAVIIGDDAFKHMVDYLAKEVAFPIGVSQDIYSSDCIPFADKGIPAINFMRFGSNESAHIHDRYDTMHFISNESLENTYSFIELFSKKLQEYIIFPIDKKIPSDLVQKVDKYLMKKDK